MGDILRHVLLGQRRECTRGGHLHFLVDLAGANVECAAEDEREAEDVVHLVRKITAPSGDDRIAAHRADFGRQDFRDRIGEGKDDRLGAHRLDHGLRHGAGGGEADKDVGVLQRFLKRPVVRLEREPGLVRVHSLSATLVDHARAIAHREMLAPHAEAHIVLRGGNRRGASARKHDLHLVDVLADDFERVQERGAGNNGGTVLVVVEDRNLHGLAQRFFDVEAVWGPDVLEVDAAHRGLEELAELDHVVRRLGPDFEVKDVDVSELLEEVGLAFHHRLAGGRADVAKAEDGGAVAYNGDEIPLGRVLVDVIGVVLDLQARLCHARGVRQRQITLVSQRFGGDDGDFAGAAARMIVQRVFTFHRRGNLAP